MFPEVKNSEIDKCTLLEEAAREMRCDCLKMGLAAGREGIHLGGAFSCIEMLAALYLEVMKRAPEGSGRPYEDRFILSKGHAAPALYAAMRQVGLVAEDELDAFKGDGAFLSGHPSRNVKRGIDFSSGSLGQGLSLAVGVCLAARLKQDDFRTFVVLGDGECDEGSVWEAAMAAAHYRLGNLVAIVDANVLQYDGATGDVMSLGDLPAKWGAFGWEVEEIDGHEFAQVVPALERRSDIPRAVIARTVKGKGAGFAENARAWHHAKLTESLYLQALCDLGLGEEEACDGLR